MCSLVSATRSHNRESLTSLGSACRTSASAFLKRRLMASLVSSAP
jgi:hypothetical protein